MQQPKYFIFDLRARGPRLWRQQELIKIILIAVACLSIGFNVAFMSTTVSENVPCASAHRSVDKIHKKAGLNFNEPRQQWSSSDQSSGQSGPLERTVPDRRHHSVVQKRERPMPTQYQEPAADVPLDDEAANGQRHRRDYKSLWRYYRLTANVSKSPYARPRQNVTVYKNMAEVFKANGSELGSTIWDKFHAGIGPYRLYDDPSVIEPIIKDLQTAPVAKAGMNDGGTQFKLFIEFDGPGKALFKPLRLNSSQEDNPNHFYFNYFERHYSEIAAYHLDRILGFHRAPPVAGRIMNMITDIRNHAEENLRDTFYISPAGNICATGSCKYYCDTSHGVCGSPDTIPGSLSGFLPEDDGPGLRMTWRHPWRRSYSRTKLAPWELDSSYCSLIKTIEPYDAGRRMLDIMDMAVLDYISNNLDRHHYETFYEFGNESSPIHLDHGRSFNKASTDEPTILAPLSQCCLIRRSTLKRLLDLTRGPKLSELLDMSLRSDVLYPLLSIDHLRAVDRRVHGVLEVVEKCLEHSTDPSDVIIQEDLKAWKL